MSEARTRTAKDLKQNFATFQLMFSIQKFIVEQMLAKIDELDFKLLGEREELIIPFADEEVVVSLSVIKAELGDFISLNASLNQLGEELDLSFDISEGDVGDKYQFILSVSSFPEEHYTEEVEAYEEAIANAENIGFEEIDTMKVSFETIEESRWQKKLNRLN